MSIKLIRIISPILLVLCMALIFYFSSQTADVSSKTSGKVIEKVASVVVNNYKSLKPEHKTEIISKMQFTVRKIAHYTIYFALGIFSMFTFITYKNMFLKLRIAISSIICLIYASSDEIHQLFVSGRGPQVRDVILDFFGSITAILIILLIISLNKKLKNKVMYSKKGGV